MDIGSNDRSRTRYQLLGQGMQTGPGHLSTTLAKQLVRYLTLYSPVQVVADLLDNDRPILRRSSS